MHLSAPEVAITARDASIESGLLRFAARSVITTATRIAEDVERHERSAQSIVERARNSYREISELAESRVGRVRTIARGLMELAAERTEIRSDKDTAIDGQRVLLG